LWKTKADDVTPAPASAGINLSPRKWGAGGPERKTGFPLPGLLKKVEINYETGASRVGYDMGSLNGPKFYVVVKKRHNNLYYRRITFITGGSQWKSISDST
jgi:hypothetical protein